MTLPTDPKTLATRLRRRLKGAGVELSHGQALEAVAAQLGFRDWNTLAATPDPLGLGTHEALGEPVTVPVLRTFPGPEAARFYVDYLGFTVDWEHRFEPSLPLYRQVSRAGAVLHLSEHHGDATPGSAVRIEEPDVRRLSERLVASDVYPLRPGVETQEWGAEVVVPDPFGNRLVFCTSW